MMFDLPVLSLSGVLSDSEPTKRDEAARVIKLAAERSGFLQVIDHGMDPILISRAFELAERFFSLPVDEVRLSVFYKLKLSTLTDYLQKAVLQGIRILIDFGEPVIRRIARLYSA